MSVTLIAYPVSGTPFEIDTNEADIALTFTLQDIEDPTKKRGTFSKTITLPNTEKNAAFFGHAYNLQSYFEGFDPTRKIDCAVWQDGLQVFAGIMQLTGVRKSGVEVTYDVVIYSEEVNLFREIDGKLLTDLDFSDLNHAWTAANVSGTWLASGASGFVYPMMDTGDYFDRRPTAGPISGILANGFQVQNFKPAIYLKQYVDRIFAQSGFKYNSAFFESNRFKSLVVPYPASGTPVVSLTQNVDNIFRVRTSEVQGQGIIMFDDEVSSGFYDPAGVYDPASYTFTPPYSGVRSYLFAFQGTFVNNTSTSHAIEIGLQPGAPSSRQIFYTAVVPANQSLFVSFTFTATIDTEAEVTTRMYWQDGGAESITLNDDAIWQWLPQVDLVPGETMFMNNAVPQKIKQSDFMTDLIKTFNLMVYADPNDPKTLNIEPWRDFYASGNVNWSQKVDEYADFQIYTGDPEGVKQYLFQHQIGGDVLSKNYNDQFQESYGSKKYNVNNYYARQTKEVNVNWSPPIPAQYVTERVIFRSFDFNNQGQAVPITTGYRIGFYKYVLPPSGTRWVFEGAIKTNGYPYCGHIDDPFSPTFDLLFGTPRQVYYNAFDASGFTNYTSNNLFNFYWKNYVDELVSPEAMQVELSVVLAPQDIAQLDFRKLVLIHGTLWRLIEIRDYIAGKKTPCRVTLRRVLTSIPFQGVTSRILPGYDSAVDANEDPFPIILSNP